MTIRTLVAVTSAVLLIAALAQSAFAMSTPPPDAEPTVVPTAMPLPTPTVPVFVAPVPTAPMLGDSLTPAGDAGPSWVQPTAIPGVGATPYAAPTGEPYAVLSPTVAGPVDHTLVVAVCLDVNANDWCDAGEGIGAMPVIIQDGETSEVRAMTMTDRTGMAQRALRLRADRPLTVAVPYIAQRQTFTPDRGPEPFLIQQVPALPGLLP